MGQIIAFVNQKGGVGKTTTAVNLTAALSARGKKVLLCDFDPQANATSGLGVEKSQMPLSSYDLVINDRSAEEIIVKTKFGDLIPSSPNLSGAGVELISNPNREYALQKALDPIREQYDYIFIDCPPSLELLTLNALCAADSMCLEVEHCRDVSAYFSEKVLLYDEECNTGRAYVLLGTSIDHCILAYIHRTAHDV